MSSNQHIGDGLRSPLLLNGASVSNNARINNGDVSSTSSTTSSSSVSSSSSAMAARKEHPSAVFMKIKTYLLAVRPWSLSASLVPTILGSALAYRSSGPHEFNVITFFLTIFTVITVHGAGNVVNTYYDYLKGIDNRKSDDRTLVDHILSQDEVSELQINNEHIHSTGRFGHVPFTFFL